MPQLSEHSAFRLTPREKEILVTLAANPRPDKELAEIVGMKVGTLKVYLHHIRFKLGVQGFAVKYRFDLVEWARAHKEELEAEGDYA